MWKIVIWDYFEGFRGQHLKKLLNNFQILYILTVMLALFPIQNKGFGEWEEGILYYSIVVGMCFIIVSGELHRDFFDKQMFLCPLSQRKKREYVWKSTCVRIVFPVVVCMLIVLFIVLKRWCYWGTGLFMVFESFVISVHICGISVPAKVMKEDKKTWKKSMDNPFGYSLIALLITLLLYFAIASQVVLTQWWQYLLLVVVVFIQIFFVRRCIKGWSDKIGDFIDYEKSCL